MVNLENCDGDLLAASAHLMRRQVRRDHLPAGYDDGGAWNVLIVLFVGSQDGGKLELEALSLKTYMSQETAGRYVAALEAIDLAVVETVETKTTVGLTKIGAETMKVIFDKSRA